MALSIKYPPLEDFYIGLPIFPALKDVKKFNPDIIHTHSEFGAGLSGLIVGKILKRPVVGTTHTMLTEDEYLKNFHIPPSNLTKTVMGRYLAFFYNQCKGIISPSKNIYAELKKYGLKKKSNLISNGIKPAVIKCDVKKLRKKYRVDKGKNLIYVGRVYGEKSLDIVLEAFSKISSKNSKTKLIIIGGGPKLRYLKNLANDLGIGKKVLFTGFIKHGKIIEEKLPLLGDIFVTASKTENQPISILEAMNFGLPIMGANARGIPELVEDGKNGLLFEPDNMDELAKCMEKLLENERLLKKISKESKKTANENSIAASVDKIENVYETLISSSNNHNLS